MPDRMPKRKRILSEVMPVALLAISVVVLFGRVVFSDNSLFGSDFELYFYPVKKFAHDYFVKHGSFPLWNPYLFSGTPFIGNIQASMFYPLGILFYIMPVEYAYVYTVIIHCVVGSVSMYIFMRSLSVNKTGAFLAAVIFTYNGFFMAHLYAGHLTFIQNYIWLPLIFCFVYKFFKTTDPKWAIFAGLSQGVQILGGFPQIAFYTILAVSGFCLFQAGLSLKAGEAGNAWKLAFGLSILLGVGFLLAAVQLLPTLELTQLSGRAGGVGYWFATYDSLHPKMLLSFFIPELFGNPADGTYWLSPRGWYFWETCGYLGMFPLCLFFATSPRGGDLKHVRYFFVGLVLFSLVLALGKYNPLYPIIYRLPGFHNFRIPAQILFLYVFAGAVLSGLALHQAEVATSVLSRGLKVYLVCVGLAFVILISTMHLFPYRFFFHMFKAFAEESIDQGLIEDISEKVAFSVNRSVLLFFTAGVVLVLFHKKKIRGALFRGAVVCVTIVDLGAYGQQFVKPHHFTAPKDKQAMIRQIKADSRSGRMYISESPFLPNDGLLYGLATINGYDPLLLERYILYLQASQKLPQERHILTTSFIRDFDHKFLKMLNLRYVVHGNRIFETGDPIPRAIMVGKAVIRSREEILDYMMWDDFDPLKMVVLEPEYGRSFVSEADDEHFKGSCSISYYDHEEIRLKASSNQPGYLVLSEMFYPGWEALVDGRKVPVLRGNYLFRVISMEEGEHEVELRFVSRHFRVGAVISLLTLAGCIWFIVRKRLV